MTFIRESGNSFDVNVPGLAVAAWRRLPAGLEIKMCSPRVKWTIMIGGALNLQRASRDEDTRPLGPGDLVGLRVTRVRANKADGALLVTFGDGSTMVVPPDVNYEAWEAYSDEGDRLVAVPGNGVAVWLGS